MKYVQITDAGYLHIDSENPNEDKTKCGLNYRRYDSRRFFDEVDKHHALCHKCSGKRVEGPRTIREAFRPGR